MDKERYNYLKAIIVTIIGIVVAFGAVRKSWALPILTVLIGIVFLITIRKQVMQITNSELHYGSLYNTLDLLIRKGYVINQESEPEAIRGGRRKKLYYLTNDGKKALKSLQEIQRSAWNGIPDLAFEGE